MTDLFSDFCSSVSGSFYAFFFLGEHMFIRWCDNERTREVMDSRQVRCIYSTEKDKTLCTANFILSTVCSLPNFFPPCPLLCIHLLFLLWHPRRSCVGVQRKRPALRLPGTKSISNSTSFGYLFPLVDVILLALRY